MAEGQTVDSLLASLVGMGFELGRCQDAVNCGKLTVNDAVEWLLQGHGVQQDNIPTRSAPTLSLNQQPQRQSASGVTDTSYLPFSLPPVAVPPTADKNSPSSTPNPSTASEQQDVVSRFLLSDVKRQEKERWERQEREKATAEAKQAKLQAKQARSYVLKNIEADKEARHQLGKLPTSSPTRAGQKDAAMETGPPLQEPSTAPLSGEPGSGETVQHATGAQTTKPVQNAPAMCMLQIRLPSGQRIRERFPPSSTLQSVVDHIQTRHPDLMQINLIQPFPHRQFKLEDLASTLEDLKLTPSGNLVVKLGALEPAAIEQEQESKCTTNTPSPLSGTPSQPPDLPPQPQDLSSQPQDLPPQPQDLPPQPQDLPPQPQDLPPQPQDLPPLPQNLSPHQHAAPLQPPPNLYSWGRGHGLSDAASHREEEEPEEPMEVGGAGGVHDDGGVAFDEMEDEDEAGIENAEQDMIWGQAGIGPRPRGGRALHDWGDGHRLIDGRRPLNFNYGFDQAEGRDNVDESPSPERAAIAALSRLAAAALLQPQSPSATTTDKPITALQDLCLRCLSKRIEGHVTRQPVTTLEALPSHIACRLVEELKKSGTLRPKTLNLFLPCHLQQLSLDCYKYTTNELLQAARLHVHVTRLGLSACPLLTDQAFHSIGCMKKLQFLNVSNNKQLTDGVLYAIKDLSSLVTLVLEGTSISDEGLRILASSYINQLTHLNLNRTNVSDAAIPMLSGFTNLRSLGVEQTKVRQLEGIGQLTGLRSLNIARNHITTSALDQLGKLPELTALNVMLLEGIPGDEVLHHLQGLELKQLQMPDRHTTTDIGLCCIAGMPLVALDLSDYNHITDQGIHHIADMTSLTRLSLNNTKITDVALTYIEGLVDLKELHLDRTAITDCGAASIGCFGKLEVLSMAATGIKNGFLCSKTLNKCQHLTRLNLSRTDVTNKGIQALEIPRLSLLNLDYTCVTVEGATHLPGCPNVKVVRTNNLRVYGGDDDN